MQRSQQSSAVQNNFKRVGAEFDQIASTYEINRLSSWYKAHNRIIMQTLDHPLTGSILDIGSGTGWLLREIAKSYKQVRGIGIDISENMIDTAKKTAKKEEISNLEFIHHDWEEMDLSELFQKNIKTVICANTFHYFNDPDGAVKRMYQILCKGGKILLLERNKTGSILTRIWNFLHKFLIKDNVNFYFVNDLIRYLKDVGFTDVTVCLKIRKMFWKKKIYTSLVLISGRKP
jgi:ubiquinone/menaquinone biosynthesis C-methylase UbiE